ncbi:MAG: DUF6916 family protein [Actinomycetota bacterium]
MAVSRRIFLRGGVLAAVAYVSSPLGLFGARRALPVAKAMPHKSRGPAIPVPGGDGTSPEQKYAGLSHIHQDAFTEAIGSAFKVSRTSGNSSRSFWLTLLRVQALPAPVVGNPASMAVPPPAGYAQGAQTSAFVLEFSGGPAAGVSQDTFFFQHDHLGEFALLIVPSGPQQYTGTINRLETLRVIPV